MISIWTFPWLACSSVLSERF